MVKDVITYAECNAEGTVLGKNHAQAWKKIYKL